MHSTCITMRVLNMVATNTVTSCPLPQMPPTRHSIHRKCFAPNFRAAGQQAENIKHKINLIESNPAANLKTISANCKYLMNHFFKYIGTFHANYLLLEAIETRTRATASNESCRRRPTSVIGQHTYLVRMHDEHAHVPCLDARRARPCGSTS